MAGLGVLSVVCVAPASAFAEIVVNGGFETGAFSPWLVPPTIPLGQPNPQYFLVTGGGGHSGDHYAKLASTQLRFISQFLASESGQDYELSFWLRRPINSPSLLRVRWEGEVVWDHTSSLPDSTSWHYFSVPLHATFTGSLLEFGQMTFPGEFHIDDISVVAVPAPGAAAVLVLGGVVAIGRRRRR